MSLDKEVRQVVTDSLEPVIGYVYNQNTGELLKVWKLKGMVIDNEFVLHSPFVHLLKLVESFDDQDHQLYGYPNEWATDSMIERWKSMAKKKGRTFEMCS
jgi:hypothetical protein